MVILFISSLEEGEHEQKGSSCLLHNTLDQSLNSRPKLAIFSFALAGLVDNKAHRSDGMPGSGLVFCISSSLNCGEKIAGSGLVFCKSSFLNYGYSIHI